MTDTQMNETQIAGFLLRGHSEAVAQLRLAGAVGTSILELLEQDHAAIMAQLDGLCESAERDFAALRPEFLAVQMMLVAHSLAEERVLYARLKQHESAFQLALESGADHEMISRLIEDLSGLDLGREQWFTLLRSLRDLVQQHVETEESEVFEKARELFDQADLKTLAADMRAETNRILLCVA